MPEDYYISEYLCGFSAPVILTSDYTNDDLVFLSQHAKDQFVQWDALQTYAKRAILESIAHYQQHNTIIFDDGLLKAYRFLWQQNRYDDSFQSLCYALPSYSEICEASNIIMPHIFDKIINAYSKKIATENIDNIIQKYHDCKSQEPYIFDRQHIGRRKLRNTCLYYMVLSDGDHYNKIALDHYYQSDNFNDAFGALIALNYHDSKERQIALDDYYQKYHHDDIMLDKWFSLQSAANFDNAFDKFVSLTQHEKFDLKNPNRVRAVIGAFAMRNIKGFHNPPAYEKFADIIITLDNINPMIAARLVSVFNQWQKYQDDLSQSMHDVLNKLHNNMLSGNTAEIIKKALHIRNN